ncbi:hypothetical protein FHX48_001957 [Microbacterium halimionae]|uniref:DUF4012 domain-containing protein n=1 Tax=Microbacterium halimionae TaxID=1526413 RepID=A0A7W3JPY2_9MICO|nr:DUF4012 domain-containing protein [Microbacterium halimionae]MBA8816864.1 hypothetical protein [Microbacterium halimionae]NII94840.1 hypothetical protein [Microbacterium halimionae]
MTSAPPTKARAGHIVAWTLVSVLVIVLAVFAWIGVRAYLAYGHLTGAQATAREVAADLSDPTIATSAVPQIANDTAAARELTSDPVWRAVETLPWIGPQLQAVSTIAAAADQVASEALSPLVEVGTTFSLDTLRPVDGTFDTTPLESVADAAATGASDVGEAAASVHAIDSSALLPPLQTAVTEIGVLLDQTHTAIDAVAKAAVLMPAMLGSDGPRDYLVVFQNNAEWRSLGGIVGATTVVHTDAGSISLGAQASSGDFSRYDGGVIPLSDEILAIYDDKPALYIQNITQVPDFSLSGELAQAMWLRETGQTVDGVIAIDPVTLSYVLEATGPVTLPSGDVLSSDNAVSLLLNEVYQRYDVPAEQDAFFAAATAAVFEKLASGQADPATLISALSRAGSERRLLIWNADADDQSVLDGTTLQGDLPVTDDSQTTFGVYANDGTGSKMDYYMQLDSAVGWCSDGGETSDAALTVRLRDNAPADAANLPSYITGGGGFGVTPGVTRTVVYLYLPEGSEVVSAVTTGTVTTTGFGGGEHDGRRVLTWSTDLTPGQESTALVRVRTPHTPSLSVQETPTINTADTASVALSCEVSG